MKIIEKANSRNNNFDFLRFSAASMVILSHSFTLFGSKFEPYTWLTGYESMGSLAVHIFFIMSGFLLTKSWLESPFLFIFLKKRILRIFPALICCVFFTALIIGPIVTNLNLKEYLQNQHTIDHLKNVFLFPAIRNLPGVFKDNPYPTAVNGSLWTLKIEIIMYASVAILGIFKLLKRKSIIFFILSSLLFVDIFILVKPEYAKSLFLTMLVVQLVKLSIFFIIGSLFYLYREKISLDKTILVAAVIIYLITLRTSFAIVANYIILPYIVFYVAYANIPKLANFGKYGDFSYGMYIYAFPIQQTIMHFGKQYLSVWSFFLLAFMTTLILAAISWKYIEKPALKFKKTDVYNFIKRRMKKIFSPILSYAGKIER